MNSRVRKWLLLSAGIVAVGLGVAGAFVPLLPTTPFLLLAAACFARSSDRHYEWLLNHRWMGAYVRNYREHRATTRRVKVVTMVLLWGSIGYAAIAVADGWVVRTLLLSVAAGVTIHVLSLRVVTEDMNPEGAARSHAVQETHWENEGMRWVFGGMVTDNNLLRCNLEFYDDARFESIRYEIADFRSCGEDVGRC